MIGLGIILIVVLLCIFFIQNLEENEKKDAEYRKIEAEQKARDEERARRQTPEYILSHDPGYGQIANILNENHDPKIRQMAIDAALKSGSIYTISVLDRFNFISTIDKERAYFAIMDIIMSKIPDEECEVTLRKNSVWDNDTTSSHGKWWHTWKPKLEARALPIIEARERQAANAIRQAQLEQAEAAGQDVCWKCKTIEPRRCKCSDHTCISGNGDCSDYDGECYSCYYLYYD